MGKTIAVIKHRALWALFPLVWIIYWLLRKRCLETRFRVTRALLGFIYWLWIGRRARTRRNLALLRPDLDKNEITKGSWRVIETVARSWAALLGNEYTSISELTEKLEVKGIETLLEYYQRGRKVIIVADHVGPFDEMIGIIPFLGVRVYVPTEPIKPAWLLKLMERLRLCFGDILFEPTDKRQILSRAAHHLADGRIVVFMIDVIRYDSRGVLCQIGGAQARFPVGAVKLALEQEATIFPCFPSWGQGEKVRVELSAPFELIRTGDKNQDIKTNTRRLIEEVYAPHIQGNWDSWVRVLWSRLEPAAST